MGKSPSMDFGLNRILEMFEERFGRTATTVLLAAIGLALFGYCAKTMIETSLYFYYLAATALNISGYSVPAIIIRVLVLAVEAIVAVVFMSAVWRFYFTPRFERTIKEMEERHQRTMEVVAEARWLLDEAHRVTAGLALDAKSPEEKPVRALSPPDSQDKNGQTS